MVSERSIFALSGLLSWASYFKIIPFEWSLEELRLKPIREFKYLLWNVLFLINTWAHLVFLIISLVWNKNILTLNPWSTGLHLLWTLIFALTSVFMTQNLMCRYELAGFANRFLIFLHNEGYTSSNKLDWCSLILRVFAVMADAFSICAMLTFYTIPTSSAYFYSFFQEYESELFPGIYIIFGFWQALNAALFCHAVLFDAGIILIYWFSIYNWLDLACRTVDSGSLLKQTRFFGGSSPVVTYKKIQLHNQEFNFCYRNVILPVLHGAAILISVASYHCAIRFHDRIAILVTGLIISTACTIFICLACPVGAGLNYLSIKLIRSLRFISISQNTLTESISSKVLKSLRPIRIKLWSFLYMQRITTLQLIGIIVFSTLKTLLLFRTGSDVKND